MDGFATSGGEWGDGGGEASTADSCGGRSVLVPLWGLEQKSLSLGIWKGFYKRGIWEGLVILGVFKGF